MNDMNMDGVHRAAGAFRTVRLALLASLLCTTWIPASARAQSSCSLLLEDVGVHWHGGPGRYDPFTGRTLYGELDVGVRRGVGDAPAVVPVATPGGSDAGGRDGSTAGASTAVAPRPCAASLELRAVGSSALTGPGGALRYGTRDLSRDRGRAAIAALAPGDRARIRFEVSVPGDQAVAAGRYAGTLAVRLVGAVGTSDIATPANGTFDGVRRVSVGVDVESAASLGFAGTVTRATFVDLGSLKTGTTTRLPVSLSVRSTSPYTLRFSSENGGALEQIRNGRAWRVPYTLYVGGRRVALGGERGVLSTDRASLGGERLPLDFVVGEVERTRSGRYTDRVRVEIVPSRL